jgi:hypothetical protein
MLLKELTEYCGKYWVAENGEIYRKEPKTKELVRLSTPGSPPRVRLYYNGLENRPYVKFIVAKAWGADAARAYTLKNGG